MRNHIINDKKVVVESDNKSFYPTTAPFDPDKNIPELDFISKICLLSFVCFCINFINTSSI